MKNDEIKVLFYLPGRIKLRIQRLTSDQAFANTLAAELGAISGIKKVDINPQKGDVSIRYDRKKVASSQSLEKLVALLNKHFPTLDTTTLVKWLT